MAADPTAAPDPGNEARGWLNRGVGEIAVASALSDLGHEIGTSLLPTLVTSVLHAGPGVLGVIEGGSDALIGVAKLAGGPLADDPARRSRQASGGYLVTAVASGGLGAVGAVWQAALLRATAWSARGLRSPARDALLFDLVEPSYYGRASGIERAGDNAGAVGGPLLGALLLWLVGLRGALYLSAIPGMAAVVAITLAARHARRSVAAPPGRRHLSFNVRALANAGLLRTLTPVAAFELGNVAATLLILRATQLLDTAGRDTTTATALAVVLYAAHNGAATLASFLGGHWIDRRSARRVFSTAAGLYVAGYALFAAGPHAWGLLLVGFCVTGTGIGLAETAESTMIAQTAPPGLRGSAFGLLGLTQAAGDVGASGVVGLLWAGTSPTAGFVYAAVWMLIALGTLANPVRRNRTSRPSTEKT